MSSKNCIQAENAECPNEGPGRDREVRLAIETPWLYAALTIGRNDLDKTLRDADETLNRLGMLPEQRMERMGEMLLGSQPDRLGDVHMRNAATAFLVWLADCDGRLRRGEASTYECLVYREDTGGQRIALAVETPAGHEITFVWTPAQEAAIARFRSSLGEVPFAGERPAQYFRRMQETAERLGNGGRLRSKASTAHSILAP